MCLILFRIICRCVRGGVVVRKLHREALWPMPARVWCDARCVYFLVCVLYSFQHRASPLTEAAQPLHLCDMGRRWKRAAQQMVCGPWQDPVRLHGRHGCSARRAGRRHGHTRLVTYLPLHLHLHQVTGGYYYYKYSNYYNQCINAQAWEGVSRWFTPWACGSGSPELSKSCSDMASRLFTRHDICMSSTRQQWHVRVNERSTACPVPTKSWDPQEYGGCFKCSLLTYREMCRCRAWCRLTQVCCSCAWEPGLEVHRTATLCEASIRST